MVVVAVASLCFAFSTARAEPAPIKPRLAILVDTSGMMTRAPQWVTREANCLELTGFDPCTSSGRSLTSAMKSCNACVEDTVSFSTSCGNSWTNACARAYRQCLSALTGTTNCGATLSITTPAITRGDGSAEFPGCDVDGDGQANDSRIFQTKDVLTRFVGDYGELEFSLWRFKQLTAGQACASDSDCPKTAEGLAILTCVDGDGNPATTKQCAFDAAKLGAPQSQGLCSTATWTGADTTFTCSQCDSQTSFDRAQCRAYGLDQIRSGGTSPVNGTVVTCQSPTAHPFMDHVGSFPNGASCSPSGADEVVAFPVSGWDDNFRGSIAWLDGRMTNDNDELRAIGGSPIAAALRDMATSLRNAETGSSTEACRPTSVVAVLGGSESCESASAAANAAAALHQLTPTKTVPVYVVALSVCPPQQPNCQALLELDAVAAAGGTSRAFVVEDAAGIDAVLRQIADSSLVRESCAGIDTDCDGLVSETYPALGAACSLGVGACATEGAFVCGGDGSQLVCSATPTPPAAESCNAVDDDCNGLVDDAQELACVSF